MKILVTGGAGYIGTRLIPELLKRNYDVTVLDNLMYKQNSLIPHFFDDKFDFVYGDIRNEKLLQDNLKDKDIVVHLASIVGAPACKKDEKLANEVNVDGTRNIVQNLDNSQILLFASTGSVYGKVEEMCLESMTPNPLSVYGVTKYVGEKLSLERENSVAFRFATAYGLSPRLRLDLLINDFILQAIQNKYLVVYDKHFRRTFIHIMDIVESYIHMIDNFDNVKGEAYNVGSAEGNFTKEEIILKFQEHLDFQIYYADKGIPDPDQRDYEVNYSKLEDTGYKAKVGIDQGIKEVVEGLRHFQYSSAFGNII
ncbi:MAG: epimerase [Rhodopirellula sp.]|nr:epimerase [Rhodopirellula sp.]